MDEWLISLSEESRIALIVASISFIGLILNVVANWIQGKKRMKNDLVSKSRIEWIQHVRKAVAALIASYSELAKAIPNETEEYTKKIVDLQEKNEIVILYFGNEKKNNRNEKDGKKTIILNKNDYELYISQEAEEAMMNLNNNTYKNDLIVTYLRKQKEYFDLFSTKYLNENKERLQKQSAAALTEMFDFEGQEYAETEETVDENGNVDKSNVPVYINNEARKQHDYFEKELLLYDIPKEIINNLTFLSEVMRIYLKIEWKKAKKGK